MRERLHHATELLDAAVHDDAELEQSLRHVAEVNRWLGGHRAVLRALAPLLGPGRTHRILDIGTGSADIPLAIVRWARRRTLDVRIVATDIHPQMRAIAARRTARTACIEIADADALQLPFGPREFDVVLLSLMLHHLDTAAQTRALLEAARVARRAVIVNELERGWPNYLGALLLARTRWRRNRLTRHDGPVSVLRAFRVAELGERARAAGLCVESLRRRFFFRLVMVIDTRAPDASGVALEQ